MNTNESTRLKKTIFLKECNSCGHTWEARKKKPVVCPRCKNYKWNEPKKSEEEEE